MASKLMGEIDKYLKVDNQKGIFPRKLWEHPTAFGGGRGVQDLLTELDKPWCQILAMLPS
jgi:hypothetical protein